MTTAHIIIGEGGGGGDASVAGNDTEIQYNDGGALGADSGFTYDGAGVVSISDALAIGASVATTGAIRLPYNGGSSLDIIEVKDASAVDFSMLNYATHAVALSSPGSMRVNGPTKIELVSTSGNVDIYASTGHTFYNYTKAKYMLEISGASGDHIDLGAVPASAGAIRLANAGAIKARNAGNSADYNVVNVDSSNYVTLGAQTYSQLGGAANDWIVGDANGIIARCQGAALSVNRPISQTRATNSSTGTLDDVDISTHFHIHFTNATGPTVNGFNGGVAGRMLMVTFTAAGIIANEAAASTAANRIAVGSGSDIAVAAGETVMFVYDAANSRWLPIGAEV